MAKYVKAVLPKDLPNKTLELCDAIIEKDIEEGVNSSLAGVIDMAAFAAKVNLAKAKRKEAVDKDNDALALYGAAAGKAGLKKGQSKETKDTLYWFVRQIKNLLLVVHKGLEESMSEYGFNVVVTEKRGRVRVRAALPKKIEKMIEMGKHIVEHHTSLGASTPLTPALVDMVAFETLVNSAAADLHQWQLLRGHVQALNNQALSIIGYDIGQTTSTDGTIYYELVKIRKRLLQKFHGEEEQVNQWGFNVVIKESTPGRKKKSAKADISSP